MDNSVQYGIRGSGIAVEDVIPVGNRKLAHDDGGVASVAVFYYFHQVKQSLPLKHLHAKVTEGLCVLHKIFHDVGYVDTKIYGQHVK